MSDTPEGPPQLSFANVAWIVSTLVAIAIAWGSLNAEVNNLKAGKDRFEDRVLQELSSLRSEIRSLEEALRIRP